MPIKSLLLLRPALLLGAAAPAADGKNERVAREIEAMERRRFEARVAKDYAFLEQAFADDLVYTHSNGT